MLGELHIDEDCYYGIHTKRALMNFPLQGSRVNHEIIKGITQVKKAAAIVNEKLGLLESRISTAIVKACDDVLDNQYKDQFVLTAYQGGAGTSTNMNVNEVLANIAIEYLGGVKGDYDLVNPLDHVNMCQSTNDVYPTAIRIACIHQLRDLADELAKYQEDLQKKEHDTSDILRLGRTQLMDALPMMVGQGFGAYAKAASRDRWRIYKVEERLREMNIGGTAIGTGLNATLKYTYMMTEQIKALTGLGMARSDYPMDITQNNDVFTEVSGLLKACSVNLMKISRDLRLLGSGPSGGLNEFVLPQKQAGSSIMPGKVNPVIPEMMQTIAMKVMANDQAITLACSSGELELNAFSPLIAQELLESIGLLKEGIRSFRMNCIRELEVNQQACEEHVNKSTALVTALVHHIGYDEASAVAKEAMASERTIQEIAVEKGHFTMECITELLKPLNITKPGIPK